MMRSFEREVGRICRPYLHPKASQTTRGRTRQALGVGVHLDALCGAYADACESPIPRRLSSLFTSCAIYAHNAVTGPGDGKTRRDAAWHACNQAYRIIEGYRRYLPELDVAASQRRL